MGDRWEECLPVSVSRAHLIVDVPNFSGEGVVPDSLGGVGEFEASDHERSTGEDACHCG